jgi:DNA repair protein RecO (recombination protein O)
MEVIILSLIKVQGIVIKSINLGESDKIITIFSDKLGKIDVVVHAARKHKSKFMASTQPFFYGEYLVFKGKNLYSLNESHINDSFQSIIMDLERLAYGSYFLELIDNITEKESRNVTLLALLLKTCYVMSHSDVDLALLKLVVEFKAISIVGYMPQVFACTKCKQKISSGYFNIIEGGVLCSNCKGNSNIYNINEDSLQFLQFLKNIKLEDLRDINYNKKTLEYIQQIMAKYIQYHIGKEFKTLSLLNQIKI